MTRPDPVFAMVHIPATPRGDATGVVVCPAFAGEDLCNYRVRRAWAEALAQAGHPALRLDLPGMGDSAGSPREPDRVDAWKAALSDAATWLRDDADCARIAALGIGFGGMLAWLAAADGAPIDDLILWGVSTSGRRLLREVRAAGLFEIERDIELEAAVPGGSTLAEDVLDVAGQVSTTATLDALSQVDLMTLELPEPTSRRVLVFQRDGVVADAEVCRYLRERGADVTVADGNSYGAMMQYVEIAVVPTAAIGRSVSWLADSDMIGRRSAQPPAAPGGEPLQALEAIELNHDGIAIRETMLTTDVDQVTLRGVVTEPIDQPNAGICVVFFAGGADRRTGPNRLWVDLARRWAAQGVTAVRIDGEGIGDADGDARYWANLRGYYDPRQVHKTIALLDGLEARGLPSRFVLVGFCSGGYRSFRVALEDRRVVGVFAIAFPFFFWSRWAVKVRHSWVGRWRRRPTDGPRKTATIWTLRSLWRAAERLRQAHVGYLRRGPNKIDRSLERLGEGGTELLLLYNSSSLEYQDLFRDGHMKLISAMSNVRVERIPGPDVRFRPLALQRFVSDQLDEALARVLVARSSPGSDPEARHDDSAALPLDTPIATQPADLNGRADSLARLRTLVIARPRKATVSELRRQIASDLMPDVVGPDDAIGATHIDAGFLEALAGLGGAVCRRLPLSMAQPLAVLLRGRYYDAVVTWSDQPVIVMATLMLLWKRRPAHVAILMWPSKRKKVIPLRVVQRGVDRFITPSPLQRRFVQERLGIEPERLVEVSGHRIDTKFWRPLPGAGDLICSVGQEMRDYATLLAALGPLDIPCHIAPGAGLVGASAAKWWQASLEDRLLPDTVTVAAQSYAELRELYARSRFAVVPLLPSDHDNGVISILEAFAMGRTVICTESPGQVGLVEDGVNGLRVPPADAVALRDAIVDLWRDPDRCARMGAAGRALVLERHGMDRWTSVMVRAVNDAVQTRVRAGRPRPPSDAERPRR
ncbi:MAG TPA: alpha/beta fold hydrolase [Solirubrobacteraceae bacterium]|nr:alpha/beta fold hydrolase [Solirubrobacteraceae bacterium]